MDRSANIRTFDALKEFKRALQKYEEDTRAALVVARSNMQRAVSRLQTERLEHWRREHRRWTQKLAEAKVDLSRVQMQQGDMQASAVIERKRVAQSQRHLEEAERKIERVRYWARILEKQQMTCLGQCQQIERTIESDIPHLQARIEAMLNELDAYVKLPSPRRGAADSPHTGVESETGDMKRGGERLPGEEKPLDDADPGANADEEDNESHHR